MRNAWQSLHSGKWCKQKWTAKRWTNRRVDPYLVWADVTGFSDLGGKPKKWIPLTIELNKEISAEKFASALSRRADNQGRNRWIEISPLYSTPSPALKHTRFCTAIVTADFFERIVDQKSEPGKYIERFELGLAMASVREAQVAQSHITPPPSQDRNTKPASCVIGIIDDGVAFAHERFRDGNGGTRIEFMWNQGYADRNIQSPWYGVEITRDNIEEHLRQSRMGAFVDEEKVYQLSRYDFVRRRLSHGTFVLDIACGAYPEEVTGNSPRMVCVQLQAPSRKTRDRFGGWLTGRVLDGLRYILDRADKVARDCPVVVNLSFGNIAGPHDGSSMLEKAIDDLVANKRQAKGGALKVVMAAGNSNLARCHAKLSLSDNKAQSLLWRTLPDDPTPNFLEIWPSNPDANESISDIKIRLTPPCGEPSDWIEKRSANENCVYAWRPRQDALCTVVYPQRSATGDGPMLLIAIAPSFSHDMGREVAPAGTWKIEIQKAAKRGNLDIHAWIQRDETPFDFPRHARQSRFEDPNYQRFDEVGRLKDDDRLSADDKNKGGLNEPSCIKRSGTVNSIATGEYVEVIGGYRRSDGAAARYSSSGPRLSRIASNKLAPDALLPCDDSVCCHGVLSAGSRSGSTVAMDGTSVAAPQATRWHAGEMSKGQQANTLATGESTAGGSQDVALYAVDDIAQLARLQEQERNPATLQDQAPSRKRASKSASSGSPSAVSTWKPRPIPERGGHGRIVIASQQDASDAPSHDNFGRRVGRPARKAPYNG